MHRTLRKLTALASILMLIIVYTPGNSESGNSRATSPNPGDENGPYTITETDVTYSDREGNTIQAKLFYPDSNDNAPYPAIVFCEDYNDKAILSVDNCSYDWIGKVATWGYIVLLPRYTNNTPIGFQGFNNHWFWVNQTYDSIDYLIENFNMCEVDKNRIALMGHGGGGAISIVEASIDKRVKCVVTLSPIDKDVIMSYNNPYPTDWVKHLTPVPIQIQVGSETEIIDLIFPFSRKARHAEPIYNSAKSPKELITINLGNHYAFLDNPIDDLLAIAFDQKNMSLMYSISFLNYYLYNDDDYYDIITSDDTRGLLSSNVQHQGLENIIQNINVLYLGNPLSKIDLKNGPAIVDVYANITPRGIGWDNSYVQVHITPPIGDNFVKNLIFNDDYYQNSGYYHGTFEITALNPLGKYSLIVKATNTNNNVFSSEVKTFTVMSSSKKPVAKLEASPQLAEAGEQIIFNASKSFSEEDGEDVDIIRYNFSFGDGNYTGWILKNYDSHLYSKSGMYYASVIVKNEYGAESEESEKVKIIIDQIPRAKIDSNISEIFVNETVVFDANDSYDKDEDGSIVEYFFDFGDGENSSWTNKPYVIHKYTKNGTFEAKVKVKDNVGAESEWSKTLPIIVNNKEINENGEDNGDSSSSGSTKWYLIVLIAAIIVLCGGGFILFKEGEEEEEEEKKDTHPNIDEKKTQKEDSKKLITPLKKDKIQKIDLKDKKTEIPLKNEKTQKIGVKDKKTEIPIKEEKTQKEEYIKEKEIKTTFKEENIDETIETRIEEIETSKREFISSEEDEVAWDEEESVTIKEEKKVRYKKQMKPRKKSPFAHIPMVKGKKAKIAPQRPKTRRPIYPGHKTPLPSYKKPTPQMQQYPQQPVPQPQYPQPYPQPKTLPIQKSGRKKAIFHSKAVYIPNEKKLQPKVQAPIYQKPKYPQQHIAKIEEEQEDEMVWEEEEQIGLVRPKLKKSTRSFDDFEFADIEIGIPKKIVDSNNEEKE